MCLSRPGLPKFLNSHAFLAGERSLLPKANILHSIYFLKLPIIPWNPGPLLPVGLHDGSLTICDSIHLLAIKSNGKTEKHRVHRSQVHSPVPQKQLWIKRMNPEAAYLSLGRNRYPVYEKCCENRPAKREAEEGLSSGVKLTLPKSQIYYLPTDRCLASG